MFRAAGRIDRSIRSVESIVREFSCRLRGKARIARGIHGTTVSFQSLSKWPGSFEEIIEHRSDAAPTGNGSEDRRNFTAMRFTSVPMSLIIVLSRSS